MGSREQNGKFLRCLIINLYLLRLDFLFNFL